MTPSTATGLEAAGVSVKPLEWRGSDEWGWFMADTVFPGRWYNIARDLSAVDADGLPLVLRADWLGGPERWFKDSDAAKAYCEADYEQRILSALDPSPLTERIERLTRERDDAVAALALIREEAAKDNAPYGRSDSIALNHIRALTSEPPHDQSR